MKASRLLMLVLFLVIPLDATDTLRMSFGEYNVTLLDALVFLVFGLVILDKLRKKQRNTRFLNIVLVLFYLVILASAVSLLYVPYAFYKYDIKITVNLIEYSILFFTCCYLAEDFKFVGQLVKAFCFTSLVICGLSVVKSLGYDVEGSERATTETILGGAQMGVTGYVYIGMGHSTMILGSLPFIFAGLMFKKRLLLIFSTLVMIFSGIVGYSRNLWVSMTIEIYLVLLAVYLVRGNELKQLLFKLMNLLVIGGVLYAFGTIYETLVELRPDTVEVRMVGFEAGLEMVAENPLTFLFGAGKGAFYKKMEMVPHNMLIEILVSKGVVTTTLFLSIVAAIMWELNKARRRFDEARATASVYLSAILAMLAFGMFSPLVNSIVFWSTLSLAGAFVTVVKRQQAERRIAAYNEAVAAQTAQTAQAAR